MMLTDININQIFCYSHSLHLGMGATSIGLKLSENTASTFSPSFLDGDGYFYAYRNPSIVFAKLLLL